MSADHQENGQQDESDDDGHASGGDKPGHKGADGKGNNGCQEPPSDDG